MLDTLIDNLSWLESLRSYIPSVIQAIICLIWIFIIRITGIKYQTSLIISLFLLILSILVLMLNQVSTAGILGEYAFLFLSIGIVQSIFSKTENAENG